MQDRVNVLFPVENINRELDYRLFLACMYASPTNRIFVGQHDVLYRLVERMRGGVYVGKNIFLKLFPEPDNLGRYETLKRNRLTLVHLDEEGAVFNGREDTWREVLLTRIRPELLAEDDHICTWGTFQQDFYKSFDPACEIRSTGHPRFDLLKAPYRAYYADRVSQLKEKYGPFILANTNFAPALWKLGVRHKFTRRKGYYVDAPERRTATIDAWAHVTRRLTHFVSLINRISLEFPDVNIVIRPHPSEDTELYHAVFDEIGNVHLVHEGPVASWLLASTALVHSACTTGLEAHLAGQRVVQYRPMVDDRYEPFLPSLFGVDCNTEEDVLNQIEAILNGGSEASGAPDDPRAYDLLENLTSDESFAKLIAVLREAEERQRPGLRRHSRARIWAQERRRPLEDRGKAVVRPLFRAKHARYKVRRKDFPGVERAAIEAKLSTIQGIIDKPVGVKFFSDSMFVVEADE
jgi:surface carbohydrate biosynthesis protein